MAYNPGEPRDKDGKWTSGGGGGHHPQAEWEAYKNQRLTGSAPLSPKAAFAAQTRRGLGKSVVLGAPSRHGAASRNIHKALPLAKVAKVLGSNPKGLLNSVREARNLGYQSMLHITIPSNGSTLSTRERAHNRIADAQTKAARLYHKRNPRF